MQSSRYGSESWVLRRSGVIAYKALPFDPRPEPRRRTGRAVALAGILALAAVLGLGVNARSSAEGARTVVATKATVAPPELTYIAFPAHARTQLAGGPAPAELQARLTELADRYREPVGIAVADVTGGWIATVEGHDAFPQQSVSKLWVALAVFDAMDRGEMTMDTPVYMGPSDRSVFYQPVSRKIGETGFVTTLEDLLRRALIESDNAANDRLIKQVGGIEVVNGTIARKALRGVAVGDLERELQARTAGLVWREEYGRGNRFKEVRATLPDEVRETALKAYLAAPADGASPAAIVQALSALKRGELLSPDSTAKMLAIMGEATTGKRRLRGGLPQDWSIAHKTGTGPDWKTGSVGINDVALITAPDGRTYAVAVMMRQTRQGVPARLAFMQAVSRAVVAQWAANGAPAPQYASAGKAPHLGAAD